MKHILSIILFGCIISTATAQKIDDSKVPAPVTSAFSENYPAVKDYSWSKDGEYYAATYTSKDMNYAITYDVTGNLVSTQTGIEQKALPQTAVDYVSMKHPGKNIREASKVTSSSGGITYKAWVDDQVITFDADGKMVSTSKSGQKNTDAESGKWSK